MIAHISSGVAGTGFLDADTTIGRHRLRADTHRRGDRAVGSGRGHVAAQADPLTALRPDRRRGSGAAHARSRTGHRPREPLAPIGHSEGLRTEKHGQAGELRITLSEPDPPLSVVPEFTVLGFAVDPHQRPKDWRATLLATRSDRSRQVTRWQMAGCLLGKGVVMSAAGRVYKRCGCLNPDTRRRWGIHFPG
jgi:hypothetical protein